MSLDLISPGGVEMHMRWVDSTEHYARFSDGEIEVKTTPVPGGRESELRAATLLHDHLSAEQPGRWEPPRLRPEHDSADVVITASDRSESLLVQVVRADAEQDRWRFMAQIPDQHFYIEDGLTVEGSAARITRAVRMKARKYDTRTTANLVLLLDAFNVPEVLIPAVRSTVAAALEQRTFDAVWIVGAHPRDVWRVV